MAIALVCVAQFVIVLDVTVVTSALPALGRELGFGADDLQWVVTAYVLAFGGFLVAGGRAADLIGARRAFTIGLAGFTAASLACGLAPTGWVLIAARVLQGLAAALLTPAALALLNAVTEPGAARRRAVGIWTAAAAGGGASGWVLGGLLTEYAGLALGVPDQRAGRRRRAVGGRARPAAGGRRRRRGGWTCSGRSD